MLKCQGMLTWGGPGTGVVMWWTAVLVVVSSLVLPSWQVAVGDLQVRLAGGTTNSEGRVEVRRFSNESWGTVCGNRWDAKDAAVVCRQVHPDYSWGEAYRSSYVFGVGTGPIYLSNTYCRGNESNLGQCQSNAWGNTHWRCSHYRDVGVRCYRHTVRLQPRRGSYAGAVYGAVEMLNTTTYRFTAVCDSGWDDNDAKVACKTAGFVDGVALCCGRLTRGSGYTSRGSASQVGCTGSEASLDLCPSSFSSARCPDPPGLGSAICYQQPATSVDNSFGVRLTNGSSSWGRVEVKHLGVWGSVCADNNTWTDSAASVACRQLSGRGGGVVLGTAWRDVFQGSPWVTSLNCSGAESSLEQCVLPPWGSRSNCYRNQYALCYGSSAPVVEVVGGSDSSHGRVEIVMDGSRYTVCDDGWSMRDAMTVCRARGYAGGNALKGSYYGKGSGQVALNRVGCRGREDSLLQCSSDGWLKSTDLCNTHSKDASVYCHGHVVLRQGDHANGVVQLILNGTYRTVCGTGFGDQQAARVCRDHGFQNGRRLPPGSYGSFWSWPSWKVMSCLGNETSVLNCTFGSRVCAKNRNTNYAAVHCYNGSLDTSRSVSLKGGVGRYENSSGTVRVYQGGVSGQICSSFWDDQDARVVCRQQGFSGGLVYGWRGRLPGPFQLTEVNCAGSESSIFSCPLGNESCSSSYYGASAFCYNNNPPRVQLVGGSDDKEGRVEMTYGGQTGTVCVTGSYYYQRRAAQVVCRSLGYVTGYSIRVAAGSGSVALSDTWCRGVESSVLGCRHRGFLAGPSLSCQAHLHDLGVRCQDQVELTRVTQKTNTSVIGVVQLYKSNRWNYVCGTFFDAREARVVCRKLGFAFSRALPAGAVGGIYFSSNVVGGLNCTGSEDSLAACPLAVGSCDNSDYQNYASVLCSTVPIPQGVQALQPSSMPGEVVVRVDGVQSTVCSDQWDDQDAAVYCRDLGYSRGTVFGTAYSWHYSDTLRLLTNVSCSGSESSLGSCAVSSSTSCADYTDAKVFCFNSWQDYQVRLVGGAVRYEGNVEIGLNGQWGSVCDYHHGWTAADANVVCRSLGFAGGDLRQPGTYGAAATPTFIIDPECSGLESNITACPMTYFNLTFIAVSWNCNATPASVQCTGEVKLTPNATFGAVQMMVNATTSSFGLVCADGFGPQEASVVCRDLGYPYGLQMSGSAFGYIRSPRIQRSQLQCTGREPVLRDCSYSDSLQCPSRKYASVVCSNLSPSTGYSASVERVLTYPYGRARVQHMGYWGYVCPNNFHNNDAAVLCRESGYAGGVAFRYYDYFYRAVIPHLRWLRDLGCSGHESYLTRCPQVAWGNITGCSHYGEAGVFCYQHTAPQLRLVNGTSSMGRLELMSDDLRGSVCGQHWDDREASAACNSMGFNGGRFLGAGVFGQGTGDVLVEESHCWGDEKSLFDCYLTLKGTSGSYSWCDGHEHDAAVQCFNTTRLTGSSLAYYGRAEVLVNQTWVAVCDQTFDTNAARVVCRALGYSEARPQCCSALGPMSRYRYSLTATRIGLKVNRCDGSEASLLDCDVSTTATCSSGKYASVLCSNQPITERRLQTRLKESVYGLQRTYVGSVQVNRYGFWGPVCNNSWDDRDANATCHGLGYNYGISFYGRDWTKKPMVVGKFQCTGRESSLADCQFGDIDDDLNCSLPLIDYYNYHNYRVDAGALCYDTPGVGLRLVDGGDNYGRLEVQYQGEWGRVADYHWSNTDAAIACRQLGFLGGRSPPYRMRVNHPVRSAKIWMAYVYCSGKERTLFECYNYWDYQTYWARDANVICNNKVRLARGNLVSVGVVEVNINNKWGSVCDDTWSDVNTRVTCRNLGYDDGFHVCCDAYGHTHFPLMGSVSCSPSDTDLTTCQHSVPSTTWCLGDNAAVACYKGPRPTAYNYTLVGSNNTGVVAITFMGIRGRICSDGWDNTDAKVFCSELGYPYGQAYEHVLFNSHYYSASHGPYWATNVQCQGTESSLRDCGLSVGSVTQCRSGKAAGVLCTNTEGIFYRLQGDDSQYKGRVEVAVDGRWGSVCRHYFGWWEASAFCRSQGFSEGWVDYQAGSYPNPPDTIYQSSLMCQGTENSLDQCPHTGWKTATSSWCTHSRDANVICFSDVRIGGSFDPSVKQGIVQFYKNGTWYNLCDTGFDDVTARRVCQDLEFSDGRALCCSAYGSASWQVRYYQTHLNYTMRCLGDERSSTDCIKQDNNCQSGNYASVVCFGANDYVDESTYSFDFVDRRKTSGVVAVTHMNITGRVCNEDWDDQEAQVLCRAKGHLKGIAFHYSQYNYHSFASRGPFWVSSFNCTGNETRLNDCPFRDRLHLGNCRAADLAGAVCFNDSGIQYRISSDVEGAHEGRVEVSVGGVWGTVCRYYWDDREARVLCRGLGYNDGFSVRNSWGTRGSGPMWLSRLRCTGTEPSLHKCPHAGFSDAPVDDGYYSYGCSSHSNDAYVSCVDKLKLSLGYASPMGAVMVYRQDQWTLICDTGLDHAGAQVVCRQSGFHFGASLAGSRFGPVQANISLSSVRCKGTEADFSTCTFVVSSVCMSGNYASVFCSNSPIHEESPNIRVKRDNPREPRHGFLEIQVDGVWGAVCADVMDSKAVTVACKQLGFTGGVRYTPNLWPYKQPILTSSLQCGGTETTVDQCARVSPPASARCDYTDARAGLLCYNDTEGISYRLAGDDTDKSRGRVEMKYMGQWGFVCTIYGSHADAQVACRSMGYKGGLAISGTRFTPGADVPAYFFSLYCTGNESAIPECWSSGFKMTRWWHRYWHDWMCRGSYGPFSVKCYPDELAITAVRLADGPTNSSGRVEVFLQGPNQWGTVCDDSWDDVDATVLCNQLGFATGKAVMRAGFGQGKGRIVMDNVGCRGTEIRLQDCGFSGYNIHNCVHSEDAGALCSGVYVPPTTTTAKPPPTQKPTPRTTPGKTTKPTAGPVTEKSVGTDDVSTAAIVTPIVLVLLLLMAAAAGFVFYRRRQADSGLKRLHDTGLTDTGAVSFGQGGAVRFMNRVRGRGKAGESGGGGGGGGGGGDGGISNPSYDSAAGGVFETQHADFSSDA